MKNIFLILLILLSINSFAQDNNLTNIEFDQNTYNFGKIDSKDGLIKHRYNFKNVGKYNVIIKNVNASCGCTTPSWTKNEVKPNEYGFIDVIFNPYRMEGKINKEIWVFANTIPNMTTLKLKGYVKEQLKNPDWEYPLNYGAVRFVSSLVSFGDIIPQSIDTAIVRLYNQSAAPITITEFNVEEKEISSEKLPKTIQAYEKGELKIYYNTKGVFDFGTISTYANIVFKDYNDSKGIRVRLLGNIVENWIPKHILDKPKFSCSYLDHNFDKIDYKRPYTFEFQYTNIGFNTLIVSKAKCTNPNVKLKITGNPTPQKGVAKLEVTIDPTEYEKGYFEEKITLTTNDKDKKEVIFTIKGNITF